MRREKSRRMPCPSERRAGGDDLLIRHLPNLSLRRTWIFRGRPPKWLSLYLSDLAFVPQVKKTLG
jgi:hypothetical protein